METDTEKEYNVCSGEHIKEIIDIFFKQKTDINDILIEMSKKHYKGEKFKKDPNCNQWKDL